MSPICFNILRRIGNDIDFTLCLPRVQKTRPEKPEANQFLLLIHEITCPSFDTLHSRVRLPETFHVTGSNHAGRISPQISTISRRHTNRSPTRELGCVAHHIRPLLSRVVDQYLSRCCYSAMGTYSNHFKTSPSEPRFYSRSSGNKMAAHTRLTARQRRGTQGLSVLA